MAGVNNVIEKPTMSNYPIRRQLFQLTIFGLVMCTVVVSPGPGPVRAVGVGHRPGDNPLGPGGELVEVT